MKKISDLRKDYNFYKDLSEKRDKRIRELENLLKFNKNSGNNISSATNSERLYKFDENPEEKTDSTILLLKSKLHELKNQKDLLEKNNKELLEKIELYERKANITANDNPNYLYELKNTDKDLDMVTEDHMNELIYILIKNFEANKIDNNIIEARIFCDLPELKDENFVGQFTNNILGLLRM